MAPRTKRIARQIERQRSLRRQRRAAAVAFLGGRCARCGGTEDLQIRAKAGAGVKSGYGYRNMSPARLFAALEGCELSCLRCTTDELRVPIPHGTARGYKRGCRCQPCRGAATAAHAEWRASKRVA